MTEPIECSFCGKSRREVAKLVASDKGTAICDECLVVAFVAMTGSGIKLVDDAIVERLRKAISTGPTRKVEPGVSGDWYCQGVNCRPLWLTDLEAVGDPAKCPRCETTLLSGAAVDAAFCCPRCGMVSHHPDDKRHGYCGNCEAYTAPEFCPHRRVGDRNLATNSIPCLDCGADLDYDSIVAHGPNPDRRKLARITPVKR